MLRKNGFIPRSLGRVLGLLRGRRWFRGLEGSSRAPSWQELSLGLSISALPSSQRCCMKCLEGMSEKGFPGLRRSGKLPSWQELHAPEHIGTAILTEMLHEMLERMSGKEFLG